jgi:hypothetical protein
MRGNESQEKRSVFPAQAVFTVNSKNVREKETRENVPFFRLRQFLLYVFSVRDTGIPGGNRRNE